MTSPLTKPEFVVPATVASDDGVVTASFDAEPWFRASTDEELLELANLGWGGCQAADSVALHLEADNKAVAGIMEYLRLMQETIENAPGFEVYIDPAAAERWLQRHKPVLAIEMKSVGQGRFAK